MGYLSLDGFWNSGDDLIRDVGVGKIREMEKSVGDQIDYLVANPKK